MLDIVLMVHDFVTITLVLQWRYTLLWVVCLAVDNCRIKQAASLRKREGGHVHTQIIANSWYSHDRAIMQMSDC